MTHCPRPQTTPFFAERVLTLDGVPVNVEAAVHWHLPPVQAAPMPIHALRQEIVSTSQRLLTRAIGSCGLVALLIDRDEMLARMCKAIECHIEGLAVFERVDFASIEPQTGQEADNESKLLQAMALTLARHRAGRILP